MKNSNHNIKAGETVLCVEDQYFKLCMDNYPTKGCEYIVEKVDGNYIWLKGFETCYQWHVEYFEVRKTLLRRLAGTLIYNSVEERTERVFVLNAKF
jgi:hypothetical protein